MLEEEEERDQLGEERRKRKRPIGWAETVGGDWHRDREKERQRILGRERENAIGTRNMDGGTNWE